MKKISLLILGVLLSTTFINAQKHGIKLNTFSLSSLNIGLNYEYVIDDASSVQLTTSFLIPQKLNERLIDALDGEGESSALSQNFTGYSVQFEYRRYTKQEGPQGFYFGPWVRHYNYWVKYEYAETLTQYESELKIGLRNFSGGFMMGSQFLINDKIAIDINWFGLGVAHSTIYGNFKTNDPTFTMQEFEDDLGEGVSIGPELKVSGNDSEVKVSASKVGLASRSAFRIGYFF